MSWPSHIFREYDIRGLADKELTSRFCVDLGKAMGTYFLRNEARACVVGRDNRKHSLRIVHSLIEGLCSSGVDCLDIGMVPTPVQYYAMASLSIPAGVQVTGSHNPPEFNGFKITLFGLSLFGDQIKEIELIARAHQFQVGRGKLKQKEVTNAYIEAILSRVRLSRKLKVVVDAGNGMGSVLAPEILGKLGCEVVPLYCSYDSRFPNHIPDPSVPAYMEDLKQKVVEEKADLGIGLDGDCDRIGLVDEKGNLIYGDMLLLFYAYFLLQEEKGAKIIYDVKCSRLLQTTIERWGGVPIMWKTGHSLIKKKLKEEQAKLAGEMSGHMYFAHNYFGFDDALYGAALAASLASSWDGALSTFFDQFPKLFSTPEIRIEVDEEIKFKVVEKVKEALRERFQVTDIDGVRIETAKGWGLLRASNTQPVLVMRFEAEDQETLEHLRGVMEEAIEKAKEGVR